MSFLDRLRGQGKLHKEGEFTLDVEQASSKLSRFQFRDDRDFLYHLVGGLFRLGAEGIEVEWQANRLSIRMLPLNLPHDFLSELPGALLDENSPQRRLAAAAQSLLVHKLVRFDWLGAGKNQLYDYLSGKGQNWEQVAVCQIQLEGLPSTLVEKALAELQKRAVYCRKSLRVQDRSMPMVSPSTELAGLPATCQCRPGQASQLELVVDEMVCPAKPVETPFAWHGVCYGDFRLDVSLTQVVEDELYAQVAGAIEDSLAACIEKVLHDPPREIIGKLLSGPTPEWLAPLLPRLRALPLFSDQRSRKWSLRDLQPPIYFSGDKAPVDLPETILVETSTVMRACLQAQFGNECRHAGEVVLRQLRRQLNQHEWGKRPQTGLALPERNWLAQKKYEQSLASWMLGVPDDWANPGGTVTLLHQGRKLCTRRLAHNEIAFTCICEIAESQINELWDDVLEPTWKALEPRWLHSLEEVIREMGGDNAPQGAMRTYLVEHLGRSQRPQDSYFAKTLLFSDWYGRPYSLFQLLALEPGQTLCIVQEDQQPLEDFVPVGVFLRAGTWESRLFKKLPQLKVFELNYLLADLKLARGPFQEDCRLLPEFGQGVVHFCVGGVQLEPVRVDSVLAFEAWVRADEVTFQIRLENQALGLGRFRLSMTSKTRRLLDSLIERAGQLPVPQPLDAAWQEWAREATVRKVASPQLACWPTLRDGMTSLEQLQKLAKVNWTSGSGSQQFARELLLVQLTPAAQKHLESQCKNEWVCQDGWFAEQERLRIFLQGPAWTPDFTYLARQPGIWLVADKGPGVLYHLLRGRWLREEQGVIPSGLRATVNCESFEDSPDTSDLPERVRYFLRQWLAQPRDRATFGHWREWETIDSEVALLLRRQGWFHTNHGQMSWEDLMQKSELFRVVSLSPDLPVDRVFVAESGCPQGVLDSLLAQHGKSHSVSQTDRLLQEEKRLAGHRQRLQEQSRRLARLKFKIQLEWGEVGLSGKGVKDCWLLLPDRAVLLHNVPTGLVGAIQVGEDYRLRRVAGQEQAELAQWLRRRFYDALLPLLMLRVQAGRLNAAELMTFCECLMLGTEKMASVRWIPCADGSLTSLAQLKLESEEHGQLGYWPKSYALCSGGPRITPILSTPLLLEVVGRYCGRRPVQLPKPLLHQDVKMPSFRGVGQVLRSLGNAADRLREQVVNLETKRAGLFETLFGRPPVGDGKALLTALRRQASQLTQGQARRELLGVLERARIGNCSGLWDFSEGLVLSGSQLKNYLGDKEPPVEVTLSLLLSLVSAINARSEPFTDEMEEKFLGSLTAELVGSWATSGNAGSGEVTRS